MIGISKLYCGTVEPSDVLRYGAKAKNLPSHLLQFSADKKPVVVWNCTRRCNLRCRHCYSQSADLHYESEMTTAEGFAFLEDLAQFGAPVVLFSGGEPLTRPDLPELAARAVQLGLDFGTEVEVTGGISAGDRVVVNPTDAVREDALVDVRDAPKK